MNNVVIIGAGECGARAAFALREKGFSGAITLVGGEAIAPYERPPLSKDMSTETLAASIEPKWVAGLERYAEAGITLLTGIEATAIDRAEKTVSLSDGRAIPYDRLLLATGARPRPLPGTLPASKHVRTLRTHADALAIRARLTPDTHLAVIGGGFIGLELAATARTLGAKATVIEGLPRVLSRGVPDEIARVIADRHEAAGTDILCGVKIAAVTEHETGAEIRLEDGRTIAADLVVVGIGAIPNTSLAEAAGLAIDNGIAVDTLLQTSDPDILAAGDCCSFPLALYGDRRVRLEAWRNAQEQGTLAAGNLIGEGKALSAVPWFWSDQYDLTLQIAGLAEGATQTVRREIGEDGFILFHLDGDGRLIAASGIGRGNVVARDIRLAEMLIAARSHPDPVALAAPETKLKKLLAA